MFTFSLKDMKQSTCFFFLFCFVFFSISQELRVVRDSYIMDKNCITESKAFLDKNFTSSIFKRPNPRIRVLKLVVKSLLCQIHEMQGGFIFQCNDHPLTMRSKHAYFVTGLASSMMDQAKIIVPKLQSIGLFGLMLISFSKTGSNFSFILFFSRLGNYIT